MTDSLVVGREKARVPRYGALSVRAWDSVALLLRDAKEAAAWNAVECGGFLAWAYIPLNEHESEQTIILV